MPGGPRVASKASAHEPSSYACLEAVVDPLGTSRGILGVADADPLLGELLADDLQLALVLGGVAGRIAPSVDIASTVPLSTCSTHSK